MIPFAAPPRAFSTSESLLAYRYRSLLEPKAAQLQANAVAARSQAVAIPTPRNPRGAKVAAQKRAEARRAYRQRARQALESEAARQAPPCGLGVIELAILRWVIGQLVAWIMREWLEGKDGDDAAEDD